MHNVVHRATISCKRAKVQYDPNIQYYAKVLIKIYWEKSSPSVKIPSRGHIQCVAWGKEGSSLFPATLPLRPVVHDFVCRWAPPFPSSWLWVLCLSKPLPSPSMCPSVPLSPPEASASVMRCMPQPHPKALAFISNPRVRVLLSSTNHVRPARCRVWMSWPYSHTPW